MGLIYVYRGDGLGTRMLTILQARVLADLLGCTLKIVWSSIGAPFYEDKTVLDPQFASEVFATNYLFPAGETVRGELVGLDELNNLRLCSIAAELAHIKEMDRASFVSFVSQYDAIMYDLPYADLKVFEGVDVASLMRMHWNTILWNKDFARRIEACISVHPEYLAVHFRRGDLIRTLSEANLDYLADVGIPQIVQRYAAFRTYSDEIDAIRRDEMILVCGEERGSEKQFERRYGQENVVASWELFDGTPNQQAFADLILLSRAKILIAPVLSFYSRCAASVGTCTFRAVPLDIPSLVEELVALAGGDDQRRKSVAAMIFAQAAKMASANEDAGKARAQLVSQAERYDPIVARRILERD